MYFPDTMTWYPERLIRLFAGIFVLGSALLGYFEHPHRFLFTGFVDAMLTIFALTGLCPVSIMLYRAGARALQMLVRSEQLLKGVHTNAVL